MLKKSKAGWYRKIKHMAIAKKITLLYGGIFSVSLLIISLFMTLNISAIQQQNVRFELIHIIGKIEDYIYKEGEITGKVLNDILNNKYIEVSIYCQKEQDFYYSRFGEMSEKLIKKYQLELKDMSKNQEDQLRYQLKDSDFIENGLGVEMLSKESSSAEYILEGEDQQKFMLISTGITTENDYYQVDAIKRIDINKNFLRGFIIKLCFIDFIGIFCAFLVGRYISWRMLQPVEAIRIAAERITIEDLSQRIDIDGPDDEMKELTVTFNSMIDRLESSFERQNQFISDASHELRTPISVIQGYANLMNRWGKSDPEILQESLDSILGETEHMSALIRKLLFLAKGDQNHMLVQKEKLSLNELAEEVVKELNILEVKRDVIFEEKDKAEIWADYDLIKQLLWIYAENAVKYTNDNDKIIIKVWKDKKYAYVSLEDTGSGITKEDLPKIFNRFYRVDKSRNKEISGTGLGLSIAKWILDSHLGYVEVESVEGEGTRFINRFALYQGQDQDLKALP